VAHAFHQFPQTRTGLSGQVIAGVAQIVRMYAGQPGGLRGFGPDAAAEVPSAQRHSGRAGEDERVITGLAIARRWS
jgi:hypothetical protein